MSWDDGFPYQTQTHHDVNATISCPPLGGYNFLDEDFVVTDSIKLSAELNLCCNGSSSHC